MLLMPQQHRAPCLMQGPLLRLVLLLLLGAAWRSHVDAVVVLNPAAEGLCLCRGQRHDAAQHLALLIHTHLQVVQRVFDTVASQHLAQVLRALLNLLWPAVGQGVVLVRELGWGQSAGKGRAWLS